MTTLSLPGPAAQCAIGCVRVSTDQQVDRYGPDRQRRDIEREAAYAGLTVVHWIEESVSGAKEVRYNENAYYDLAKSHPGLNFIFSTSSRVGRHVEIIVGIARKLLKMQAGVWVAGIGDLRRARNWKEFLRDAVDAENEYTGIVRQLTDGKRDKAQAGGWAQGRPPFGYRLVRDDKGISTGLDLVPEAAATVRRVAELYATYGGNTATARQANLEGLRTSSGREWTESAVAQLVRNERYTGRAEMLGHTITFPAIIDAELWQNVQAQMKGRRKGERTQYQARYLLSGLARCSECGGAMTYAISGGGGRGARAYHYYRCWRSGRVAEGQGRERCTHRTFYPLVALEDAAWTAVGELLTQPDQVRALLTQDAPPADHAARLGAIRTEMAALLSRAARFDLPDDVVEASLEPLQQERARLEAEQTTPPLQDVPPDVLRACQDMAQRMSKLGREQRRSVLQDLRVRLDISPGGAVCITDLSVPVA